MSKYDTQDNKQSALFEMINEFKEELAADIERYADKPVQLQFPLHRMLHAVEQFERDVKNGYGLMQRTAAKIDWEALEKN